MGRVFQGNYKGKCTEAGVCLGAKGGREVATKPGGRLKN